MIASESMRAMWCPDTDGDVIVGFEWVCTTGGRDPVSHHLAQFLRIRRKPGQTYPISLVVKVYDDLGVDPMLQAQVTHFYTPKDDFVATVRRVDTIPSQMIATLPVVRTDEFGSCLRTIRRSGEDYVKDHMCYIQAMRRIDDGVTAGTPDAYLIETYSAL